MKPPIRPSSAMPTTKNPAPPSNDEMLYAQATAKAGDDRGPDHADESSQHGNEQGGPGHRRHERTSSLWTRDWPDPRSAAAALQPCRYRSFRILA